MRLPPGHPSERAPLADLLHQAGAIDDDHPASELRQRQNALTEQAEGIDTTPLAHLSATSESDVAAHRAAQVALDDRTLARRQLADRARGLTPQIARAITGDADAICTALDQIAQQILAEARPAAAALDRFAPDYSPSLILPRGTPAEVAAYQLIADRRDDWAVAVVAHTSVIRAVFNRGAIGDPNVRPRVLAGAHWWSDPSKAPTIEVQARGWGTSATVLTPGETATDASGRVAPGCAGRLIEFAAADEAAGFRLATPTELRAIGHQTNELLRIAAGDLSKVPLTVSA